MSGSKKWMTYSDDLGNAYSVFVDESNGEALGFLPFSTVNADLPKAVKMRYGLGFFLAAPNIKRKVWIGALEIVELLIAAPTVNIQRYPGISPEPFIFTYIAGERRSFPSGDDTGINDGDNP